MKIIVRNATLEDIPQLVRLEESWPEGEQASEEQIHSRLNIYPQGYYVGCASTEPDYIIAACSGCPITYDPSDLSLFSSWEHATHDGYYHPDCAGLSGQTLYIAASCTEIHYRGNNIYLEFMNLVLGQMKAKGAKTIVSGNVLPGYDRYCKKNGEISAKEYVFKTHRGLPIDPFLRILYKLGFLVPNEDHVIEDYYHDGPSRHYASIIVNDLSRR